MPTSNIERDTVFIDRDIDVKVRTFNEGIFYRLFRNLFVKISEDM